MRRDLGKGKGQQYGRRELAAVALLSALVLVNVAVYLDGAVAFGGDQVLHVVTPKSLFGSLFIWSGSFYSGITGTSSSLLRLPVAAAYMLLAGQFGLAADGVVAQWFYFTIGAAGMFLLVLEFTKRYGNGIAYPSAIASALLFAVSYESHLQVLDQPAVFLPFLVLFIYLLVDRIEMGKTNSLHLAMAALSFGATVAIGNYPYLLENVTVVAILSACLVATSARKKETALCLGAVIALGLLMNLPLIGTAYLNVKSMGGQVFNNNSANILWTSRMNIAQAFFAFSPVANSQEVSWPELAVSVSLLALVAASLFSASRDRADARGKVIIAVTAVWLAFIFLVGAGGEPFGEIFNRLLDVFPQLLALRGTYIVTHYIFLFIVVFLSGTGMAFAFDTARRMRGRVTTLACAALVVVFVAAYLYAFDFAPIALAHQADPAQALFNQVYIPDYVMQIATYVNAQPDDFAVATLPKAVNWQSTTWYVGMNIYSSLIEDPVYTGGYASSGGYFYPISENEYEALSDQLGANVVRGPGVANALAAFGIRYVIVQDDAIHNSVCSACFTPDFNLSAIYSNLEGSDGISLVGRFGNNTLFEDRRYVPLVYASDIRNMGNETGREIVSDIETGVAPVDSVSLYSDEIDYQMYGYGFYNSTDRIHVDQIAGFEMPSVSFSQDTPTHVAVRVLNATSPFYLVFRSTYDPKWIASYGNGTAIPDRQHVAVNGFANAWYVDGKGSYTMSLYYAPQSLAWEMWAVSAGALALTLYIEYVGARVYLRKEPAGAKKGRK